MIDRTHDPALTSWVESANTPGTDFPIQNLPWVTFRRPRDASARLGIGIGDRILDAVSALTPEQFTQPLGNSFSSIRDTIAHICDAESIWIRRWNGEQPLGFQNPERILGTAAAREEWAGLERQMREVLETMGPEDFERTIEY